MSSVLNEVVDGTVKLVKGLVTPNVPTPSPDEYAAPFVSRSERQDAMNAISMIHKGLTEGPITPEMCQKAGIVAYTAPDSGPSSSYQEMEIKVKAELTAPRASKSDAPFGCTFDDGYVKSEAVAHVIKHMARADLSTDNLNSLVEDNNLIEKVGRVSAVVNGHEKGIAAQQKCAQANKDFQASISQKGSSLPFVEPLPAPASSSLSAQTLIFKAPAADLNIHVAPTISAPAIVPAPVSAPQSSAIVFSQQAVSVVNAAAHGAIDLTTPKAPVVAPKNITSPGVLPPAPVARVATATRGSFNPNAYAALSAGNRARSLRVGVYGKFR